MHRATQEDTHYLDLKQASEFLCLKPSRIYYLVFRNKIPHYKIGSSLRFNRSKLVTWLENQEVGEK